MNKEKNKSGKKLASAMIVIMIASIFAILLLAPVAAPPVPSGEEGIYYLVPKDSTATGGHCNNVTIDVWVNSSLTGATPTMDYLLSGKVTIETSDKMCGNITSCSVNATEWPSGPVGRILEGGKKTELSFGVYMGSAGKLPGNYNVGNITVHCNSGIYGIANLSIIPGANTYIGNITATYFISGENGTFTCPGATTNVTAPEMPAEPIPIPSGWMLNWTKDNASLTFNRTDSGGLNYTNLSASEPINVNVNGTWPAATIPKIGEGNLTVNMTTFGDIFNVTISNGLNATIYYYSVDKYEGNAEAIKNLTVRIDKTEPLVTPLKVSINETNVTTLNVTIIDPAVGLAPGSGVKNATVDVSAISTTPTAKLIRKQGSNFWTNITIIADIDITKLENLTITAYDNASNKNYTVNMTVKHDVAEDWIKIYDNDTGTLIPEGTNLTINRTYRVEYRIENKGNYRPETVDITANVSNLTWTTTIADYQKDVDNEHINYTTTWNTTGCTEGNYTIWVNASLFGDADLTNNNRSRNVTLEIKAYGVSLTPDKTEQTVAKTQNATYTLEVRNTGTEQDNFTLLVDNPNGATTAVISDGNNGTWTSPDTYKTKDINSSESVIVYLNVTNVTASVKTFRVNVTAWSNTDTAPILSYINTTTTVKTELGLPKITIDSPENNSIHSTKTITLSVSANRTIHTWMYRLNGAANVTFDTGGTTASTPITAIEGLNNITVHANDTSENMGNSSMVYFTVDTKKPTVTINTPISGFYNESFEVNATVIDQDLTNSSGIKEVKCRWENTTVGGWGDMSRVASTNYWTFTPDIAGMADGNYTINVTAWDNATNANYSTVANVAIDKAEPTFEINFATNYPLDVTNLSINVSDQYWPLATPPTVTANNGSAVTVTQLSWADPTWTGSYPIITTGTSNYTITVSGTDLAGNAGTSVAYSNVTYTTYTEDTETSVPATPPNTTVNITSNGTVAAGVTVTKMEERPPDTTAPATGIESAGIFIDIDAEQSLVDAVSWVNITIYYNVSDIPAGVLEETLRIYYYNGTGWERYDYPDGGVNTTLNYVWANLQHLSTFAVMGVGDTTPPTVTGTPTGTGIAITTTISATFNEAMNQASARAAFSISPSVSGAFSWVGNTMTFTPSANLAYSTDYTVTIATTATDAAGNPLALKTWTFTTASQYVSRPGGGARVVAPAINVPIDPTTGAVTSTTTLTVEKATLTIAAGVIIKDAAGNPLATSITTLHTPTTAETVGAIAAYDFGPSGTTFSEPIDLVIEYDPADIPAGFSESDLVVRMYDGAAKAWIDLDTSVDTVAHTATAKVSHFSIFALFTAPPVAPPPVTPTPTVTPTVPPVTPTPPVVPPPKLPWGLIIGIIIAVIIVGAAAYYFYTKKKA